MYNVRPSSATTTEHHPLRYIIAGNPDSFSSTFVHARENLLNPGSKAPQSFHDMSPDELYNVLSAAFLIMEEERGRFKEGLEEVEKFYKKKIEEKALRRIVKATRERLLSGAFGFWASVAESESITSKGNTEREKRVTGNAKRQIKRMLFALMRKTFHGWHGEVGKGKVARLEDEKEGLRREMERMREDIESLVKTRGEFVEEHRNKVGEVRACDESDERARRMSGMFAERCGCYCLVVVSCRRLAGWLSSLGSSFI